MRITKQTANFRIDPGIYTAGIVNFEEAKGPNGQYLKCKFQVKDATLDGEALPKETFIFGNLSMKLFDSPKCQLAKWLAACGIQEPEEGESVELDEMVGHVVQIVVEDNTKNDKTYSNVTNVLPIKKKAKVEEPKKVAAKPAAKKEEVEEAEEEEASEELEEKPVAKKAAKPAPKEEEDDDLFDFEA